MKILEVIYGLSTGGAERLVVDLCNEMSKTEDVTLLILKEVNHFYLPQVSPNVKVIQAHWKIGFSIMQQYKAYKLIKEINPDIVHFHNSERYSMILSNILLKKKYSFFMTIHSDVEKNYKKGLSGLQVKLCGLLGGCKFITISETNYLQFQKLYPKFQQILIENGRALPQFTQQIDSVKKEIESYKKDHNTIVFIHVARYHPCKNQEMLIEVFNELISENINCILLVIGSGFETDKGSKIVEKANKGIYFLGSKNNIYDYLKNSDVFCLSSIYEGMPMSIIEAILSGIPIISTPVCGAIDAVKNGYNGFISSSFEKESYKKSILEFIKHKDSISDYSEKNKNNSKYAITNCAQKYISFFKSTIEFISNN
jgi:glycosyltransferase involved in cell wall biosynthesis